jgi:tetratricopeptide (TPR) repeat protein
MSRTVSACSLVLAVVSALCALASPQLGPDNPFEALELKVHITLEGNRPLKSTVRVQLLTSSGAVIRESFTNQEGWAFFPRMGAGEFQLKISGEGIERFATGAFTIYRQERQHIEFVQVHSKDGDDVGHPGSVAAAELSVPAAAKKEYEEGAMAFKRAEWVKAGEHFERATALYPGYSLAHNAMGAVHLKTNNRELARQCFEKAIGIDGRLAPAYVNLARITFQDQKYDEAESLLLKSLSIDPGNPETLTLLAAAELLGGKYDEAVTNARQVHSVQHKGYAIAHYLAARALEAKNLPAKAIDEYNIFLQEAPSDPNAARARDALVRLQK